jgi:predicted dehydrogenase
MYMRQAMLLSRRHFLRSSTLALASAPLLAPRSWGAEGAPSERFTLGFIGMGKQNSYLLTEFLHRPGTQVVAVCDVDTTRRENAKKKVEEFYSQNQQEGYKGCTAYPDFRDVLARKDIDAVVIATPDHWHALIAIAAANAGKDIYCEKPLCQSIHEARAMVNAVRKNKRIFQTGSMQRSSREFRTTADLVRNGRIGKIHRIEVAVGGPAVPCNLPAEADEPGLDWNLWLGPAPMRQYNSVLSPRGVHNHFPAWRNYREYGGGGVTDWGAHHFDIAQWAMDMDESGPVEIFPAESENAKTGVRYLYANGTEVLHKGGNGITFFGTEGKLYVNRGKFELWLGSEKKAESVADLERIISEYLGADAKRVYNSKDHKLDFLQAMRTRKPPIADVETGARTVSVCHLVNLAYYNHAHLKWNPKTEQFEGGTGNPAWLDRSYRSPWTLS